MINCITVSQVGIYLLEAGLSKPEFLSDGGGRPKKANQLIQKLMEKFYSFLIPGKAIQLNVEKYFLLLKCVSF